MEGKDREMKGIVYEGPNILGLKEVGDVSPGPGEVKLRVRACGICGSDVHGYLGITGRRLPPMIMGHEFAGEVAELGQGVDQWKKGDQMCIRDSLRGLDRVYQTASGSFPGGWHPLLHAHGYPSAADAFQHR